MFLADTHAGTYLLALLIAGLLAWSRHRPFSPVRAFAVFVLSALAVASDRELWVAFVVPIVLVCAAALAFALLRREPARFAGVAALGAFVAAGAWTAHVCVQPHLSHAPDLPTPGIAQVVAHLPRFWNDALGFTLANPNLTGGVAVLALAFLAFPFALARRPESPERARGWFVWAFGALSIGASLTFTVALYVDFDSYRYFEPALFMLVPIAVALLARSVRVRAALPALAVAALLGSCVQIARAGTLVPGTLSWRPDLAECLGRLRTQYGLQAGLAGFWTARPLTVGFDHALQVDQISADGSARFYNNDPRWYDESLADPALPPAYRFIVLRELDGTQLAARFGPPEHVAACVDTQVWIYDDPRHLHDVLAAARR